MNDCGNLSETEKLPKDKMEQESTATTKISSGSSNRVDLLQGILALVEGLEGSVINAGNKEGLLKLLATIKAKEGEAKSIEQAEKEAEGGVAAMAIDSGKQGKAVEKEEGEGIEREMSALLKAHEKDGKDSSGNEETLKEVVGKIVKLYLGSVEKSEVKEEKSSEASMDCSKEGESSSNIGSSSSSSSSTNDSSEKNSTSEAIPSIITSSLEKMQKTLVKESTRKSCMTALLKMFQNLRKRPGDSKNRKHLTKNIIIKKYVLDVDGALSLFESVGFKIVTEGTKEWLMVESEEAINSDNLSNVISGLEGVVNQSKTALKGPKVDAKRVRCLGGCGFWGDENTENYCSLCHKNKICGISGSSSSASSSSVDPNRCKTGCGNFASREGMCNSCFKKKELNKPKEYKAKLKRCRLKLQVLYRLKQAPRLQQKNKTKCWACRRKVGITGIECKCGFIYCGEHRYPDLHKCTFDHKKLHRHNIRKQNQQIMSEKFDKA